MEIKSKNDIIDYFASGIKQDELIGVENEQFLFNIKTNKRAEYENIKKLLQIINSKIFAKYKLKKVNNLGQIEKLNQFVRLKTKSLSVISHLK